MTDEPTETYARVVEQGLALQQQAAKILEICGIHYDNLIAGHHRLRTVADLLGEARESLRKARAWLPTN
jgi:hypothetical protein